VHANSVKTKIVIKAIYSWLPPWLDEYEIVYGQVAAKNVFLSAAVPEKLCGNKKCDEEQEEEE